jgi:hypothetical protein
MDLPLLGTAGMGLVLGWLLGNLYGRIHNPQRTILTVAIASLLVLADLLYIVGPSAIIVLIAAFVPSLIIHILWRRQLYDRYGLPNTKHSGG